MSQPSAPAKPTHEVVLERFDAKVDEITKSFESKLADQEARHAKELDEVKKSVAVPQRDGMIAGLYAPNVVRGGVRDSAGYSILKAAAYANGYISAEDAKEELAVSRKLHEIYKAAGYSPFFSGRSFMVPFSTEHMPTHVSGGRELAVEIRQKMWAGADGYDPDEAAWLSRRTGFKSKALGTLSDAAGGVLQGFPTLGELIDLQRNMEVFPDAGAREISLPSNALMDFPKLTGGSTAYWVGEAAQVTESTATTGNLKLIGKKLAVLCKLNNELIRYANPTAEAMVRGDMAAQAALKADLAQLEGTGGTQIKGLITYPTASSWSQGTDAVLTYSVTSNVFQPQDVYGMEGVLPDVVQKAPKTFLMRNDLWGYVRGRRADAVSGADAKGPFVFNITRGAGDVIQRELNGYKVVTSSQISNTRSTSKTYVILGAFQDWIIARFGVMEFLTTNTGDTAFQNDQTWLRAIQIMDAGPRHSASFCFADNVNVA